MFVALNKDKKRVHISNVLDKETYYLFKTGNFYIFIDEDAKHIIVQFAVRN